MGYTHNSITKNPVSPFFKKKKKKKNYGGVPHSTSFYRFLICTKESKYVHKRKPKKDQIIQLFLANGKSEV